MIWINLHRQSNPAPWHSCRPTSDQFQISGMTEFVKLALVAELFSTGT